MMYYQLPTTDKDGNPLDISGQELSRAFCKIILPADSDVVTEAFGYETKEGLPDVIAVDDERPVPVYVRDNFEQVIDQLATLLAGSITPIEGAKLSIRLRNNERVMMTDLIPASFKQIQFEDLYSLGYRVRHASPV